VHTQITKKLVSATQPRLYETPISQETNPLQQPTHAPAQVQKRSLAYETPIDETKDYTGVFNDPNNNEIERLFDLYNNAGKNLEAALNNQLKKLSKSRDIKGTLDTIATRTATTIEKEVSEAIAPQAPEVRSSNRKKP